MFTFFVIACSVLFFGLSFTLGWLGALAYAVVLCSVLGVLFSVGVKATIAILALGVAVVGLTIVGFTAYGLIKAAKKVAHKEI